MTAPHLAPGHKVAGRYTVRALLELSGESASYHAVADSGHEVVLKLFDHALGQRADVMSRLERVNSTVSQLPFELVVPVADSGYDPTTSAPFVVSELVRHPTLAALVAQQGPLPAAVVARLVENLGKTLDLCHSRQLAHLALKPTNIFVGPAPDYPVRLSDFGASVVRNTSPTHESYLKSAPWWSPEQLQPAAVLAAPADIFSAGLVAFFALTGRSFWGSCQSSAPDLATWQVEVMAPRLSVSQRGAQLGVGLPPTLDAAFARVLAVNPQDRPRSLAELAHALAAIAGGGYRSSYAASPAAPTAAFPEVDGYPPAPPAGPYGEGAHRVGGAPFPAGAEARGVGYPNVAGQSPTPGLPPLPPQERRKPAPLKPVLLGIGGAVTLAALVGVAIALYNSSKAKSSGKDDPIAVTATPGPSVAPEPELAPTGTASSEPDPPPVVSSEAPSPSLELTLVCIPQCDELTVDGDKVEKLEEKTLVSVAPGKHLIEARKLGGYSHFKETIDVETSVEKEIRFYKFRPAQSAPVKPCVRTILKPRCP